MHNTITRKSAHLVFVSNLREYACRCHRLCGEHSAGATPTCVPFSEAYICRHQREERHDRCEPWLRPVLLTAESLRHGRAGPDKLQAHFEFNSDGLAMLSTPYTAHMRHHQCDLESLSGTEELISCCSPHILGFRRGPCTSLNLTLVLFEGPVGS